MSISSVLKKYVTPRALDINELPGIVEGLCLVNAMHISASIYINDDESGLLHDYDKWLERLAPLFYGKCDGMRKKRVLVKVTGN